MVRIRTISSLLVSTLLCLVGSPGGGSDSGGSAAKYSFPGVAMPVMAATVAATFA